MPWSNAAQPSSRPCIFLPKYQQIVFFNRPTLTPIYYNYANKQESLPLAPEDKPLLVGKGNKSRNLLHLFLRDRLQVSPLILSEF